MAGTVEYEELNKDLEIVDGHAVKALRIIRIRRSSIRRLWHGLENIIRPRISL